jgi:hypothetical protein
VETAEQQQQDYKSCNNTPLNILQNKLKNISGIPKRHNISKECLKHEFWISLQDEVWTGSLDVGQKIALGL